MVIKWHENVLHFKNKKIELEQKILKVAQYTKWLVVATPHKLFFFGNEDYTMSFPILAIDIADNHVIYQDRTNYNIYKVLHPYDEEIFLFNAKNFIFKFLYLDKYYFLEKENRFFIKNDEDFFELKLIVLNNLVNYILYKFDIGELNAVQDFLNKSFDTQQREYQIFLYTDYVIILYENTLTFLMNENNKLVIREPIYLNEKIYMHKIIRFKLITKSLYLLQINNLLFYRDKLISQFSKNFYPDAFCINKYSYFLHDIFWKKPDALELRFLEPLNDDLLLKVISECINTGKYNFNNICIERNQIDDILELEFIKENNLVDFVKKIQKYDFLENSIFYSKINHLSFYKPLTIEVLDLKYLLSINYKRIFYYNPNIPVNKDVKNLAYMIIYYEKNRNARFKKVKKLNMKAFFKKEYKDDRMSEVINLFYEPVKIFNLDENINEDTTEKSYLLRISVNIGKSFCFFDNNFFIKQHKLNVDSLNRHLIFPLEKNGNITNIELKDKTWINWPSFNYGCCKILGNKKKVNFKHILTLKDINEFMLSGLVFGFGIKNLFRNIEFLSILEHINEEQGILLCSTLAAYGISNRGIRNNNFEEYCFKNIMSEQSINVRIGSLIGLSNIFASTKNLRLINILKKEIEKNGIFLSEKYNKNNTTVYDKYYKLICTFNLAKVVNQSDEFVFLENRLCELIFNGICLKNKFKHKQKFERHKGDPLEEIFYSHMFLEECCSLKNNNSVLCHKVKNSNLNEINCKIANFDERIIQIENNIGTFTIWDVFKYAGIVFYYGISRSIKIKRKHIDILLMVESIMIKDSRFRVLFDYILIAYCLSSRSNCDLELLRIIRRQIKRTENKRTRDIFVFTNHGIKKENVSSLTYGDFEKYKICLGILCLGLTKFEIIESKFLKLSLISTFYVTWPTSPHDQEYLTFYRYELFQNIGKKTIPSFKHYLLSKYFKKKFKKLENKEKKFILDVLGDYYENYHNKEDYVIDIEYLKDLIIKST